MQGARSARNVTQKRLKSILFSGLEFLDIKEKKENGDLRFELGGPDKMLVCSGL